MSNLFIWIINWFKYCFILLPSSIDFVVIPYFLAEDALLIFLAYSIVSIFVLIGIFLLILKDEKGLILFILIKIKLINWINFTINIIWVVYWLN